MTALVHAKPKTTPSLSKSKQGSKIEKRKRKQKQKKKKPNLKCFGWFDVETNMFPSYGGKSLLY